jgi:L-threonylcarbamoyladenylate synthase
MQIISKEQVTDDLFIKAFEHHELFIYPTDTIYGIGCSARDEQAVEHLRNTKRIPNNKPLSILVPNKNWIYDTCEITSKIQEWIDKLPGPYTLILRLRNPNAVAKNITFDGTIAVRIPDHWMSVLVNKLNIPIVTTSANISGETFMTSLDDLSEDIKKHMTFVIYEGEKKAHASSIINLVTSEVHIRER